MTDTNRTAIIMELRSLARQAADWEWMTHKEVVENVRSPDRVIDPETAHIRADAIQCDLLVTLGYADVVEAWQAIEPRWYS